ncbi:hypothetical protein AB833_13075 [Chromatiales bacterium (ex Bugula neritina AB1)]|nr:hypothetical protein AB833_13075 [Chromatiales bacterium (ex Bugula neritina AB1)]
MSGNKMAGIQCWLGDGQSDQIRIGHSFTVTSERAFEPHEHLFKINDMQSHIYQVLSGVVGVYNMLPDGRRQIVTFYYPGDLIGIEESESWRYHGEVLCRSRVRSIPITIIDRLLETEPGFGQAMLETLATELAEIREQLLSLGQKSAIEKVATFLLRISRRNLREGGNQHSLYLPMTRSEIGDYLGLTIETVSRNISKLKTSGLIHVLNKNTVQILDLPKLEELADGNS